MRRLVIAAAISAAVVGSALPTFAAQTAPPATQKLPVTVSVSTNGGVFVGTTIFGQPGLAASVANGQVCVGFSLEIPICAGVPPITVHHTATPASKTGTPTQSLPGGGVVVYHDDTRTAVGVGDVGVIIYSNGDICPVVSTQAWRCVQLG